MALAGLRRIINNRSRKAHSSPLKRQYLIKLCKISHELLVGEHRSNDHLIVLRGRALYVERVPLNILYDFNMTKFAFERHHREQFHPSALKFYCWQLHAIPCKVYRIPIGFLRILKATSHVNRNNAAANVVT